MKKDQRRRFFWILTGLLIGSAGPTAVEAGGAVLELVPKVGYAPYGGRDLSGPENTQLSFADKPVVGLSLGYLTRESGEVEIAWSRANSTAQVDKTASAPPERFDVRIDTFRLNGLYMLSSDSLQPFALLGVGATHYDPSGSRRSETRFSFAAGGGVKWLWNDHLGLRLDGLWTPTLAMSGSDFFCDPAGRCASAESNSYVSRLFPFINSFEFTSGLMLRY